MDLFVSKKTSLLGAVAVWVTMIVSVQAAVSVDGAGATLPHSLYSHWISEFQKTEPQIRIKYHPVGSSEGIRQFLKKNVDFGASDIPLSRKQIKEASEPILQIPTAVGAVAVSYNLRDVKTPIQLKPDVLADIFLGKITDWDDQRIADTNPEAHLPNQPIFVIHRSDGSGTTAAFTQYLSKVSHEWKKSTGSGPTIHWPVGLGGKGNEGTATLIKQTPGAIGYVGLTYAEKFHLNSAAIENREGSYRLPTVNSISAAAENAISRVPRSLLISISDPKGKDSYPICSYTYLLVYQSMSEEKGKPLIQFLSWALSKGQSTAAQVQFAPLPSQVLEKVKEKIKKIA
jgi:phosphate transport system substrate-binding protein